MTYLEQAIRDAVEKGGWERPSSQEMFDWRDKDGRFHHEQIASFLLDPAFWQALGKARWETTHKTVDGEIITGEFRYKDYWHRLIDHLAGGGDVEEFFKSL